MPHLLWQGALILASHSKDRNTESPFTTCKQGIRFPSANWSKFSKLLKIFWECRCDFFLKFHDSNEIWSTCTSKPYDHWIIISVMILCVLQHNYELQVAAVIVKLCARVPNSMYIQTLLLSRRFARVFFRITNIL